MCIEVRQAETYITYSMQHCPDPLCIEDCDSYDRFSHLRIEAQGMFGLRPLRIRVIDGEVCVDDE